MGVLIEAFFTNCPALGGVEGQWWNLVLERLPALDAAGFTALWLPPPGKAANIGGMSMGYDPFDYYDLGDFAQRDSIRTWFGNRAELEALIGAAHGRHMQVYADMVLNHCSGGEQEPNPINGKLGWTRFEPRSGRFARDATCFHPCRYESWDDGTFGDMPDLCHRNPRVYSDILDYGEFLIEEIGFDGFRFDFVKGYGAWIVRSLMELPYARAGERFRPFGVGECWDSNRKIEEWQAEANNWSDNPVAAFDFPLRERLVALCQSDDFSLRDLAKGETVLAARPNVTVTFVENHDTDGSSPIVNDKMLAYAFILTHEGYPCVFWRDYFEYDLGKPGAPNGIAALVRAHEDFAGGDTTVLHVDDDLYISARLGHDAQRGLILVLNNSGEDWKGTNVDTPWRGQRLQPIAWWSARDAAAPAEKTTNDDGATDLWAPPRGYVVYAPT